MIGLMVGLLIGCSDSPTKQDKSATTHITAGVMGRLVDAQNNPVSGVVVRLYPVDYVPSLGMSRALMKDRDTTDTDGVYEIPDVDTGTYNLEGKKDTLGVFIDSIDVADDTSVIDVPPEQLKKLGKITGITHMPGQSDTNQVRVNIYIPGTNRITLPNIGGKFAFDIMPAGKYQIIINPTFPAYNVRVIDTILAAGETLDLDTIWLTVYEPDTFTINASAVYGTWGPNKTYIINSNVEVPDGQRLRILPNTKIIMQGYYFFKVHSSLIAIGAPDSFIVFSSGLPNANEKSWQGFYSGQGVVPITDTMLLRYCIVEYAEIGLYASDSSLTCFEANNCIFRYSRVGLIPDRPGSTVSNCIFHDIKTTTSVSVSFAMGTYQNVASNNIFVNLGICFWGDSTLLTANNNCFYNIDSLGVSENSSTGYVHSLWTLPAGNGNIFVDPQFTSLTKGHEDYHLSATSPCRGTGMNGSDIGVYSTYKP